MIGTRDSPAASSALRMPATRPSIMSLGATRSTPARACVTAPWPSRYPDASFSTSPSWITPQWPWSVYSHRQTSPTTSRSGTARFTARAACCTIPCSSYASEPVASFAAGRPNSMTPPSPRRWASSASFTSSSSEVWYTPGSAGTSRRTPSPWHTNRGHTSCAGTTCVSCTRRRSAAVRRNRGARRGVVRAHLEPERALPRRGHHLQRIEPRGDLAPELEPLEPRPREQRGVESVASGLHLLHSRRHIAAERHDLEVGTEVAELRDAPQARGPDPAAGRELGDRDDAVQTGHQRFGRIGPGRHGAQREPIRQARRQVLERVHGDVDAAREQRLLDFPGEEPLPLELVQRPVYVGVAARPDDHELDHHAAARQLGPHPFRLPQGQPTAPRTDLQGRRHPSLFPLPSSPKYRTSASTSPGTVYSLASMATWIPSSRAASAVTGPIAAAANRPDVAASRPTMSTK